MLALLLIFLIAIVSARQGSAAGSLGTPTTLSIPHLHNDGTIASVGNRVLFAGGSSYDGQTLFDTVDIYDASTNHWTTATLSQPRTSLASVTIGSKVFFAGGRYDTAGHDSTRVDIYDSQANSWSTVELSEPRHYVSPVAVGGKVIFAGGWDANVEKSTVDIYDTQSSSWTSTTLPGPTSGDYQATSAGTLAYIANHDSVNIFDSQTNTWLTPHPLSVPRTTVAAVTLGTQVIFAGGQTSGDTTAVDIYDTQTNQWHTANLSQGRFTSPAVFAGKAYFLGGWTGSSASATIDVYDGSSWTTDSLPGASWGDGPVVADGKLFVEVYGTTALVYEPATPPTPVPVHNGTIAFSHWNDGAKAGEIYAMKPDGSSQTPLTTLASLSEFPSWSPDGSKLVFDSWMNAFPHVSEMNANGSGITQITHQQGFDWQPAWSPDGTRIAFISDRDGSHHSLYVMNSDGSNVTRLTYGNSDQRPTWSPDSNKIAYADGAGHIDVVSSGGGSPTVLTSGFDPAWSPDGTKIAFAQDTGPSWEIYAMNAGGGNLTQLTFDNALDTEPAWSPDGSRIVFAGNKTGTNDIYIIASSGGGETKLTTNSGTDSDSEPAWTKASLPTTHSATFTVHKTFSDNNSASVSVNLVCDSGSVTDTPKNASQASSATFTVNNVPQDGTSCTATEVHSPSGYTMSSDCTNAHVASNASCTITNTLISSNAATFTVNVTFNDNNSQSVLITPTCSAGSTSNAVNANRTAPAVFSVTGIPAGGTTCRASAFGSPPNYSETSTCDNVAISPGGSASCAIAYTASPTLPKRAVVFIAGIGSCGGGPSDGNTCKSQPLCGDTGVRASTGWMRDALLNSPQLASRISLSSSDIVYFSYSGNYCDLSHGENGADPKYSKVDTCNHGIADSYFGKLKDLVQRVTDKSPGMQVSIIAHSQGGLIASYFVGRLRQDDPDFLRKRVASVITFDSFPEGFSAPETAAADAWFSASDEYYRDCAFQSSPLNPPNVVDWNRSFSAVPGIARHAAEPFGTDSYQVAFYTLTADRFGGPTNNDPIPDPATHIHQERHNEKIPGSGHSSIWSGIYQGIFNQTAEDTSRRRELVICSLLSGLNHKGPKTDPCNTSVDQIAPGQTRLASMNVPGGASRADFDVSWAGSTVQVTVITPTGQRVDASNLPSDASHSAGPTFESFVFLNPESGLWQLEMYGADVHPQGENVYIDTNFSLVDTHPSGILGDANCDGRIDVLDVTAVLGNASGTPSSNDCIGNGDVDGDGHITAMDGLLILKYMAGLISRFPAAGP